MNKLLKSGILTLSYGLLSLCSYAQRPPTSSFDRPIQRTPRPVSDNTRIQVAILLDTSNSMDGLIEQAKSRLWNIINTLSTLRYGGRTPVIEIALYEYGNSNLSASGNYIRQIVPLSTDLDLISEHLFGLSTRGGEEYCGAVIQKATQELEWTNRPDDIKLIYIAGNEPFDQGSIPYANALSNSVRKGISTTTIYCGDYQEGINGKWKAGAAKGNGKYFNINSDRKIQFIETPYDEQIDVYNSRLNDTYIGYGSAGSSKKAMQVRQDANAGTMGKANAVERSVSKSKAAYTNSSWDLVDYEKANPGAIEKVDKSTLPAEYKNKSTAEIKAVVKRKQEERESYQKKIGELAKQRQEYIDKKLKETSGSNADDLGTAINNSILELAKVKGYSVHK